MKRPNITPGPWEVTDSYTALFHNDLREEIVYEINGIEAGNSPAYATSEDHAHAIAAVPRLLEVLENVVKDGFSHHATNDPLGLIIATREMAKSALIKAGYTFD